jgi:hypothetical protein
VASLCAGGAIPVGRAYRDEARDRRTDHRPRSSTIMKKSALLALPVAAVLVASVAGCSSDDDSGSGAAGTTSASASAAPAAAGQASDGAQRPADVAAQNLLDKLHAALPNVDAKAYHGTVTVTLSPSDSKAVTAWIEKSTGMPASAAAQISVKDPSSVAYGDWLVGVTPSGKGGAVWKVTSDKASS